MEILQQILSTLAALVMTLSAQIASLPPSSQLAAVAPTSGLVGYWNFDEGGGTIVNDSSGNGNTGTINGASWTGGKVGSGSLDFDGTNYISVANTPSLQINGDITMCAWVYPTAGGQFILAKYASTYDYAMYLSSSRYPTVYSVNSGYSSSPNTASLNQWSHLCISVSSTNITYYINGTAYTLGQTATITNNNKPLYIGSQSTGTFAAWKGKLDEVRIYNRALGPTEILDIYNYTGGPQLSQTTPSISSFSASPPSITFGQSSTLSWSISGDPTPTLSIDNGVGIVTGNSVSISPTQTITYTLTATNSQGSATANTAVTVTAPPQPDIQAPSVPTGLSATAISSSQINLSWSASIDNVSVTGYKIYRNGSQIGTSGSAIYSDTGLSPSTSYLYTISAYDVADNNSNQSSPTSATTQTAISGSNIYTAQSQVGTGDGSSCINAKPVSFFNTASNWGTGNGKIGPGVTVHLCGTFTGGASAASVLTPQGGGLVGSPVIILFEPGAKLSASYWNASTGAINISGVNYVVVDGGVNGIIENTENGTNLTYQVDSRGIYISNASNIEIKNLTIRNIFVKTGYTSAGYGAAIYAMRTGSGNLNIHNNMISGAKSLVYPHFNGGAVDSITVANNTLTDACHMIDVGGYSNGSVATNVNIYGNDISGWDPWWSPANDCHTDGIMIWSDSCSPTSTCKITGNIYNNYIHGHMSSPAQGANQSPTGFIYTASATNLNVFNNLLVWDAYNIGGSPVWVAYSAYTNNLYNNTFVGGGTGSAVRCRSKCFIENNIVTGFASALLSGTSYTDNITGSDYNNFQTTYWEIENDIINGQPRYSLAQWQSVSGFDSHSVMGNPNLNTNYKLQTDSPAIGGGINLTNLGITALNTDKVGITRPTGSTAWDIGAYQFGSGGTPSSPDTTAPSIPSGLSTFVVSSSQINLSWTASTDNVAVTGYRIYRAGMQIGTSATNSYSNTSLSPSTLYLYTVSAYDAAGNTSNQSSPTSATTLLVSSPSVAFTTSQRIQTTSNLNVRATASASGTLLGTQSLGSLGTIISGGTLADGLYWWNVNYDSGVDGYSAENYLASYTAPSGGGTTGGGTTGSPSTGSGSTGNTSTGGSTGSSSGNTGGSTTSTGGTSTTTCTGSTSSPQVKLTRNLYRTIKGDDVKILQNFLISQNLLSVDSNTGFFGPLTEKAVQAFQKAQGIVSSGNFWSTGYGMIGPTTRAKINSMLASTSCSSGNQTVQTLQEQIKILQAQVNALLLKLQKAQ
jgi:chitodextrinase